MKKKTSTASAAKKSTKSPGKKELEFIAIEVPVDLVKGMELVGITDQQEYIRFLIASSLLNYSKIWKEEKDLERELQKIKADSDSHNYLR
jgi:hypothetical protein